MGRKRRFGRSAHWKAAKFGGRGCCPGLKPEGITNVGEVVDRCRRQANADMSIDLLPGRDLIGCAEMQQVARSTALRKVSRILDKRVHGFGKLPVQEK